MKRFIIVLVLTTIPFVAQARHGFYGDFSLGPQMHFGFDEVQNKFPNGISIESHTSMLNELDFGYSFKKRFTLGVGFEFNNLVDVGYKADFKWSFFEGNQHQPYVYFCIHGGISDVPLLSLHAGFGVDIFVGDRLYFLLDARMGPSWVSADPARDPQTDKLQMDFHFESAVVFGIGTMFGSGSKY